MHTAPRDIAQVRLDNALALFDEFVRNTVKDPDAATLRGLERRFAERLQIQPSYWSQIKGRSRQIGERLARQFEELSKKPFGWMDVVHPQPGSAASNTPQAQSPSTHASSPESPLPQDDDERFIVGLVLTYYRRHPQRARTRLLDLLGEVLMPPGAAAQPVPPSQREPAAAVNKKALGTTPEVKPDDEAALWQQTQAGIAPLKRKR